MKVLKPFVLSSIFFLSASLNAEIQVVYDNELIPNEKHTRASELITHILSTYHYKKTELNDQLSHQILDNYIDALDSNKSYFTKQDIQEFNQYETRLDDLIKSNQLEPAFDIFKRFRKKVERRSQFALKMLEENHDFTVKEEYRFDRRDDEWPVSEAALDEIWRKRVKNDMLNLRLAKKETEEIKKTLSKRYTRLKTGTFQLEANDVFQSFINAYTTAIEPHTAYFSPRTSENFDISMRLSLQGIGAVLRAENDYTKVVKVISGGPADLSDEIDSEDTIIGVAQGEDGEMVDVIGWRLDDVVDMIRGPKGSTIRLEILPNESGETGPSKIVTLVRDKIKLEEQAAQSEIIEAANGSKIGVLDVPTFYIDFAAQSRGDRDYRSTSRDSRRLIEELVQQGIDGLIIDLRGNGGGSLSEALEFTGLFIDEGPVVQTKDASGRVEINRDPKSGIDYAGPLAVLVDRNSASASEIFAGAIQDYNRGIIIGETTFGKGTVQNVIDLNRFIKESHEDHGKLKTTIAQFFRVSGGSNQHKGVIPDIELPTIKDSEKHGESAYDNALPWDQVRPAKYRSSSAPIELFKTANIQHEARIKKDELFQLLLEQIELSEKNIDDKSITLVESERRKEREELKTTRKKITNAMRVAQGLEPLNDLDEDEDNKGTQEDEEDELLDIILQETANILSDLITPRVNVASQVSVENTNN